MKILPFLMSVLLLGGCTYHGKFSRGLYRQPDLSPKINASVMVVQDKYVPDFFRVESDEFIALRRFVIRTDDGLSTAAADALATLFERVETNVYSQRKGYDYTAEVEFFPRYVESLRFYMLHEEYGYYNPRRLRVKYLPYANAVLRITLRNPHTGAPVAVYQEEDKEKIHFRASTYVADALSVYTLGVFRPLQIQAIGGDLTRNYEQILTKLLKRIVKQMQDDRVIFASPAAQENLTRVDADYTPYLKAVATVLNSRDQSSGSAFFISADGYLLTNAHVVEKARDVQVVLYGDKDYSPDGGRSYPKRYARVVARNEARDLALLKLEGENFPWLMLEPDRTQYYTGVAVAALGEPKGYRWSVSEGIISALRRDEHGRDMIQTDAAVNSGNSGGPLILKDSGRVAGINTQGVQKDVAENLNFAISSYEALRTFGLRQPITPAQIKRLEETQPSEPLGPSAQ